MYVTNELMLWPGNCLYIFFYWSSYPYFVLLLSESAEKATYIRFLISNAAAGSVIGKGGATITDFQSQSGARIQLSRNFEFFPGTSDRIIMITGILDDVLKAVELVLAKLLSEVMILMGAYSTHTNFFIMFIYQYVSVGQLHTDDGGDVDPRTKVRLVVPNNSCGSIIGKGGSIIKYDILVLFHSFETVYLYAEGMKCYTLLLYFMIILESLEIFVTMIRCMKTVFFPFLIYFNIFPLHFSTASVTFISRTIVYIFLFSNLIVIDNSKFPFKPFHLWNWSLCLDYFRSLIIRVDLRVISYWFYCSDIFSNAICLILQVVGNDENALILCI